MSTRAYGDSGNNDDRLLHILAAGGTSAFERLFLRHYVPVYRVAYGLVGRREIAEDLVQETFLELYRTPPTLSEGMSLLAWLCRVALNKGHNALRGERRSQSREERVLLQTISPAPFDPEVEILRSEEQARVRDALAQLPERQAKILLLRHAGLSYAEVASLVEVAPTSIGTLLARAAQAFREAYLRSEHPRPLQTRAPEPAPHMVERTER
jgi:RNA polymerase sigma-70 factor, ECF subfamily